MRESFKALRARIVEAKNSSRRLDEALWAEDEAVAGAKQEISKANESKILLRLAEIPIEAIRDVSESAIRLETLRKFGFTSVASIYHAPEVQIEKINGISAENARELKEIAERIRNAIAESVDFTFNIEDFKNEDVSVLESVQEVEEIRKHVRGRREKIGALSEQLQNLVRETEPLNSRIKWFFTNKVQKVSALDAVETIGALLADPVSFALMTAAEAALEGRKRARSTPALEDFKNRSSDYYSVLDEIVGRSRVLGDTVLNEELIEKIESQDLDTSSVKATLRRYQVFGAKFALAQGRVILGDEMGLGKTLQAISVLVQRHGSGAERSLVVCPASVLVNWQREFEERSELNPIKMHGSSARESFSLWREVGGVGLTTFDTLKTLSVKDEEWDQLRVDTLVVDEAHYVKNLDTGRAKTVSKWLEKTPNALFMTGTPLENRVGEFVNLSRLLDRSFADDLDHAALIAGPEIFKKQVAPMYLRRNTSEVLQELPELISVTEHCSWEGADQGFYHEAVGRGNFMGMRRAGFRPSDVGAMPSKLERLIELTEEAFSSGQKVVIFSYFRDVLSLVSQSLGSKVVGPITGGTPPSQRQQLVDQFREAPEPVALVGQIQAAGTGLNMQAASVVILCEPQIKPSLEVQAIARARRMGQIRTVQVHRLIIPESVDDLMMRILERKQAEFDDYARDSALADSSGSAKDRSEESLAKLIVLEERKRLGIDSNEEVRIEE